MNDTALQACMNRHLAHAAQVYRLDDELGTHHGLSWADFVLLTALDNTTEGAAPIELARSLCMPASQLLMRLLPLEKIGLVERVAHSNGNGNGNGKRNIKLRPQGRRLLREARETAQNACTR
jgi:DNA-binding MarR family transcriptional regulator